MHGLKFILKFTYMKNVQRVILVVALAAAIFSSYLSTRIPVELGKSISLLSDYGIVLNVQNNLEGTVTDDQLAMLEQLSNEEIKGYFSEANPQLDPELMEERTGLTFKQLLLDDPEIYKDKFKDELKTMLMITTASVLLLFVFSMALVYISTTASYYIRIHLFEKLQRLSISFFDKSSDGDVLSRFTNDIDNISNLINQGGVQITSSVLLLIFTTYVMLKEQITLGVIIIVLGVVLILILSIFARKAMKYVSVQQEKLGNLNAYVDEKIAGQRVIITNGLEDEVIRNFEPVNDEYRDTSILGQTYSGVLTPIINGFYILAISCVIIFGSRMAIENVIQVGMVVTFVQFAQRFFQPFQTFAAQYNVIQLALSSADRVEEVIDEKEDISSVENAVEFHDLKESVKLSGLTFGYDDTPVLKDVNIEVEANKMIALVGPTGSGKTTIMNLMNRFYNVEDNMIFYDNVDINEIDVASLRKNVGIVLQDSVIFSDTIRNNISYGKEDATEEEIIAAAKVANLHEFIMSLPEQYETRVNNDSSVLSTGQKQLLSIARTIITNPKVLILDEATSNVDTVTEAKIQTAMENVVKNRTSFVIAHRLKTILNADSILVIKDGNIIQHGPHSQLVEEEGLYKELYYNQFVVD